MYKFEVKSTSCRISSELQLKVHESSLIIVVLVYYFQIIFASISYWLV